MIRGSAQMARRDMSGRHVTRGASDKSAFIFRRAIVSTPRSLLMLFIMSIRCLRLLRLHYVDAMPLLMLLLILLFAAILCLLIITIDYFSPLCWFHIRCLFTRYYYCYVDADYYLMMFMPRWRWYAAHMSAARRYDAQAREWGVR